MQEDLIPADKKAKILNLENYLDIFENIIDFQVSCHSDIFVPLTTGLFYYSVAGMSVEEIFH